MKTCQLCEATSAGTLVRFTRGRLICDWCADDLTRRGARFCVLCRTTFPLAQVVRSCPNYCPSCRAERRRARYTANRDREIALYRAWKQAHPGVEAARQRQRYQDDPEYRERQRAYHRAYYAANRDKWRAMRKASYPRRRARQLAWQRQWRIVNRERRAAYDRTWRARQKLAILRGER